MFKRLRNTYTFFHMCMFEFFDYSIEFLSFIRIIIYNFKVYNTPKGPGYNGGIKIKKDKKYVDSVVNIIYNKLRSQLGEMVELV